MSKVDDKISDLVTEIRRETEPGTERVNTTLHVVQHLLKSANIRILTDLNSNFFLEADAGEIDLDDRYKLRVVPKSDYQPSFVLQKRFEKNTLGGLGDLIDFHSRRLSHKKRLELIENIHDVKLFEIVDHILWEDWNPIELEPAPRDEYSGYTPLIYFDVFHRKPIERIAMKLRRIQEWSMSLKASEEHCMSVAKKLIEARDNYLGDLKN